MQLSFSNSAPPSLGNQVGNEISRRLIGQNFCKILGIPGGMNIGDSPFVAIPYYALFGQYTYSVPRIRALREPASWAFLFELQKTSDERAAEQRFVLAFAGKVRRDQYEYNCTVGSLATNRTVSVLKELDVLSRSIFIDDDFTPAFLDVPLFYLDAIWLRNQSGDQDFLHIMRPSDRLAQFGSTSSGSKLDGKLVPLEEFVKYMNERLRRRRRAPTPLQ